jgi:tetratricopeptide (TPR) repeat protein
MLRYRSEILIALALAAGTAGVYARACKNGFVNYDDVGYVTQAQVQQGLSSDGSRWAWGTYAMSNWHPLTWVSLQLDAQLYGGRAWGYHLTSVLIHAATAVLLFLVLRGMTGAVWRSALVAALFAVHPLHVESVAWVSERKDVLCAFFGVAALGAYAWYAARPGLLRYLAVAALFALGLLSKPMLVTLPCVFLLLDYWPLGRLRADKAPSAGWWWRTAGRLVLEKVPLFALSAYGSFQNWQAQAASHAIQSLDKFPLQVRVGNALVSYLTYIVKTFWPTHLAAFYPHPGLQLSWNLALTAAVLLAAVSLVVWALAPHFPYLVVGWLWYLGMLFPVIGLTQTGPQAYADRFAYLPHIGLFIMLVWAAADLAAGWQRRGLLALGAVAALLALSVLTWHQIGYWHDSLLLWQHAIEVTERNAVAEIQLSEVLREQENLVEALRHSRRAVEIDPHNAVAHAQVGQLLLDRARKTGDLNDRQEAKIELLASLYADPGYSRPHRFLAFILENEGKLDEALEHDREAVSREPDDVVAWYHLAYVLSLQGHWHQAVLYYRHAADLQPQDVRFHVGLAYALSHDGRTQEARDEYRAALALDPRWPRKFIAQAQRLATDPNHSRRNGREAVELAEKACEATSAREPTFFATLAAAYAQDGRFDDAVEAAKKALELAPSAEERDEIRQRLEAYKKRQRPP